ncbi:MAG: hypothetical protein CM15mP49_24580 [Actinomycetota bacterium]|nr:MAG: hypothetical protein CM15mP49_24580 [Actinomycetota bacterium]
MIEKHIPSGYPTDAGAVLLVEVEGLVDGVEIEALRIGEIAENYGASDIKLHKLRTKEMHFGKEENQLWCKHIPST